MMTKNLKAIRPLGAIRIAEWGDDRHRLIGRSADELKEIDLEILAIRGLICGLTHKQTKQCEQLQRLS